jgi:aryl-phospho-beta-D-glucosidase BglC (GH1 family)
MKKAVFSIIILLPILISPSCLTTACMDVTIPERFWGFNLLVMSDVDWSNEGYSKDDFYMIHEPGFNFVRLPIDYRTYISCDNWYDYSESDLFRIDRAVWW